MRLRGEMRSTEEPHAIALKDQGAELVLDSGTIGCPQSSPLLLHFAVIMFQNAVYKIIIALQSLVNDGIDLLLFDNIAFFHKLLILLSRSRAVLRKHFEDWRSVHQTVGVRFPQVCLVAAPGVLFRPFRDPGADGIVVNISQECE